MEPISVLLLCNTRIAFPVMLHLAGTGKLTAVAVPESANEVLSEIKSLLAQTPVTVSALLTETWKEQVEGILQEKKITLGLVMTFSFFIPKNILEKPAYGFYNIHPGSLPEYRGADPVFEQIRRQEKMAGVALHVLTEGADSGPVVLQEKTRLLSTYNHGMLSWKLSQLAVGLVISLLRILEMGFIVPAKAQDEKKARYFKQIGLKDIAIDWTTMDANTILALIRACNPWNKGASTQIHQKLVRFLDAELTVYPGTTAVEAGTILSFDEESMEVAAGTGESVRIHFIYTDEGYLRAARLTDFGITKGMQFRNITFV